MHPDWVLRKCYVTNNQWKDYKKTMIDHIIEEQKIFNSKKNKYLYGTENFVLGASRSLQPSTLAFPLQPPSLSDQDSKLTVDLSYIRREPTDPYSDMQFTLSQPRSSTTIKVKNLLRNKGMDTAGKYVREQGIVIDNVKIGKNNVVFQDNKQLVAQRRKEIKFALCENNKADEALNSLYKVFLKLVE